MQSNASFGLCHYLPWSLVWKQPALHILFGRPYLEGNLRHEIFIDLRVIRLRSCYHNGNQLASYSQSCSI